MNIAFVNPNSSLEGYTHVSRCDKYVKVSETYWYPIHLAYATGYLNKLGHHEAILVDAEAEKLTLQETMERTKHTDIVVLYIADRTLDDFNKLSKAMRKRGQKVIYVGPLTCNHPEDKLKYCDAVILGEFDKAVNDLADGQIDWGLVEGEPIPLDEFPWVCKTYLSNVNFENYKVSFLQYPWIDLFTSRGCAWGKCKFCLWQYTLYRYKGKNTYRERSLPDVVDEMKFIANTKMVKEIFIQDDYLTSPRAEELSQLIIDEQEKRKKKGSLPLLPWSCYSRPNMPNDILRIMRKAGCQTLDVGIEAGVQSILDDMEKGIHINQIRRFMKVAHKLGFFIHGDVMLGVSHLETEETIKQTIKFVKSLPFQTVQFFTPIPYPRTPTYQEAKENGWLDTNGNISYPWLSAEILEQRCSEATRNFFLRPGYFMGLLRNPQHLKIISRSFKSGIRILSNWRQ